MMKYILVTGGVISGVGKGIIASSIGVILKAHGVRVSAIKIDPYINIDAGTFSPYEHGEVFVLEDGGEVDLDLGNYERFLGVKLHRKNNITTGKIYQKVIMQERRGDYLGKTVQVVPHITDEIQAWVTEVAKVSVDNSGSRPEVCIIELGGTIGDIEGMPFVEAFRQLQGKVKRNNFLNVHVSLVPEPKCTGEHKTKPTQNSVRDMRHAGLFPDLVICRSETPIGSAVREKLSNYCQVASDEVICVHDVKSVYHVPLLLFEQNVLRFIYDKLEFSKVPSIFMNPNLDASEPAAWRQWRALCNRIDKLQTVVTVVLVGKYVKLEDAYASVKKALQHASTACERQLNLKFIDSGEFEDEAKIKQPERHAAAVKCLESCDAIIVPGGFGHRGVEGKIFAVNWARVNNKPFLGICLGMQCAVIDFARSKLNLADAHSTEFLPSTTNPVVVDMPEHTSGDLGGTMRLGLRTTTFAATDSASYLLYGKSSDIQERHRHRYEVNPEYVDRLEANGLLFVGRDKQEGKRMEICELKDHPYFVGTQFHPEYTSRPLKPSPPYLGLILAATGNLQKFLHGNRVSPLTILDQSSNDGTAINGAKAVAVDDNCNSASFTSSDESSVCDGANKRSCGSPFLPSPQKKMAKLATGDAAAVEHLNGETGCNGHSTQINGVH